MDSIPPEITREILDHLDLRDILHVSRMNAEFHSIIDTKHFWTNKIKAIPDGNIDNIPAKWQQFAITTLHFRKIPICNDDPEQDILSTDHLWIHPEQSEQRIVTNLFKSIKWENADYDPNVAFYQEKTRLFLVDFCQNGYNRRQNNNKICDTTRIIIGGPPDLIPGGSSGIPVYLYSSFVQ